jgi:hypothetical protein
MDFVKKRVNKENNKSIPSKFLFLLLSNRALYACDRRAVKKKVPWKEKQQQTRNPLQ